MDPLSNVLPPATGSASLTGSYHDFNGLGKLKGQARTDAKSAMRETAQQFEAMFLQQMMKSMRDASIPPASSFNMLSTTSPFSIRQKEASIVYLILQKMWSAINCLFRYEF